MLSPISFTISVRKALCRSSDIHAKLAVPEIPTSNNKQTDTQVDSMLYEKYLDLLYTSRNYMLLYIM
jgi:hypothetical protein